MTQNIVSLTMTRERWFAIAPATLAGLLVITGAACRQDGVDAQEPTTSTAGALENDRQVSTSGVEPGAGGAPTGGDDNGSAAATQISAGEIADHPERYYGQRVAVAAEVEQIFSPRLFTLDEDRFFSTGRDVLVLMPNAEAVPLDGSWVTVAGTLRPFVKTEITRSYRWLTLDPALWIRFDQRPAIVADSVRTASNAELVRLTPESASPSNRPASSAPSASPAPAAAAAPIREIGSIVTGANPIAVVGRRADLSTVPVYRLAGTRSFWVGTNEPQLFVVVDAATLKQAAGGRMLQAGDMVSVAGELRKVPGWQAGVTVADWGVIPESDAETLKQRLVYLYADQLEVAGQAR
jgi:hypothetical protein